jgi:hypothetical protein
LEDFIRVHLTAEYLSTDGAITGAAAEHEQLLCVLCICD